MTADEPGTRSLFVLGGEGRVAMLARAKGWQVTVAECAGAATVPPDATVALVETAELDQLNGCLRSLAPAARRERVALLAVAADHAAGIAYDAGATQFVGSEASDEEMAQQLRYAARYTRRLRVGERRAAVPYWLASGGDAGTAAWIDRCLADGQPVTAVVIALSRLDIVNAAHGRPGGDALIAAVGDELAAVARDGFGERAMTARVGGSEFVVVLAGAPGDADAAIARFGEALARPVAIDGRRAVLGSRIGAARSDAADTGAALLRRAAGALSAAKGSDGATIRMAAEGALDDRVLAALAVDLHHALGRDEIEILFQPQVMVATGEVTGVEALARWQHPERGELGAEVLFAAAERADLGLALSDHIQQIVLQGVAAWPDRLDQLRVSLNLTASDVARPGFAALFLARVDASGFPRERLTVEITETGLMRELETVAALLGELRAAGCRVAIDDFGTGYSSLAYLKALPLDYLKIDKALTGDIEGSARERVVVRCVISMAQALGVRTIAEGVETERQRALLAADGCDLYQGFLTAPPLDEAALIAMMERQA